jgi:hypothetical protein
MSSHDLTICLTLKAIHTLDAGTHVELKFVIPRCGEVDGGDLLLRVTPEEGERYMLGDKLTLHLRGVG